MNNGGQAFPELSEETDYGKIRSVGGMTMRQYYKAAALQGLIARVPITEEGGPMISESGASELAGRFADAMLAEDAEHAKRVSQ